MINAFLARLAGATTRLVRVLSLKQFDVSTEAGRALERDRLHALSAVSNLIARASMLVAVVLSSRIALPDLGSERFGLWMTIVSFLSLLTFLDLGVGNALVAPIAKAASGDDATELRSLITRGLIIATPLGAVSALVLPALATWLPLDRLFHNLSVSSYDEARRALQCFGILSALWIPVQTVHRMLAGLQRAYVSHAATIVCSGLTCLLLIVFRDRHLSISGYLLISFGVTLLAVVPALYLLVAKRLVRRPRSEDFRYAEVAPILSAGGLFLALQFGVLFGWGMDQALIASLVGAAAVAPYAIAARIFMLVSQPFAVVNAPLWSSYAHALGSGDKTYLRQKFSASMLSTGIGSIIGVLAVLLLGKPLWHLFTGAALPYPVMLMSILGLWTVIECTGNALAMLLNAAHLLREQLTVVLIFVLISVPAKFLLIGHYGAVAAPAVTVTAYTLSMIFFYSIVFRKRIAAIFN